MAKLNKLRYQLQLWSAKMSSAESESFCSLMGRGTPVNAYLELVKWIFQLSNHTLPAIALGMLEKLSGSAKESNAVLCSICDKLKEDFSNLLGDNAVFLFPCHPTPAPYHNQPLTIPMNFAYTAVVNVLGLPATACPMGLSREGVPIGIQVIAGKHNDHLTLAVARELQSAFGGWVNPAKG